MSQHMFTTKRNVVDIASSYIGVPFLHQGRTRNGVDCVGLIRCVGVDLGLVTERDYKYGRYPSRDEFTNKFRNHKDLIRKNLHCLCSSDILTFRLPEYECHCGFFVDGYIIHALASRGCVCKHKLTNDWKRRIIDCYAFVGVC